MEWPVEIDSHRFTPDIHFLFPDDPLECRTDAVVAYENLNWPQTVLGLRNRVRTALRSSQVRYHIVEPDFCQILLASGDAHHLGTTRG
jgi:hypothetical protein